MKRLCWLCSSLLIMACSLAVTGCGGDGTTARFTTDKLRVIVTYSVLGDMVRNVAGDSAEVVTLVGPDEDAHTFEPTPQDGIALVQAQLIFENGVDFETWLDKLYASSRSQAKRVIVSQGLELRQADPDHQSGESIEPGHEHEDDPHLWHDVQYAIHMVAIIRDELCEADPAHAEQYRANSNAYLDRLAELHQWVIQEVDQLPAVRRKLVTNHDTFGYFAARYGFTVVGTALSSVSTEASDPSAAAFVKLVTDIKSAGVPAIFAENIHNSKLMERLAEEAGVKLAPPLYTDALGPPGSAGDTYEKMMRHNVTTIVDALRP